MVFCAADDESRTDPEKKKIVQIFSINSAFCSNFLEKFLCDFCCFYIFPRFSIVFRMCVNFSGIFGVVMIFLWILELILCLHFSALFRDRKKFEKNYIYVLCYCVDFAVYLVLILGVLISVLILFLELGCLGAVSYTHLTLPTKRIV